MAIAPAVVYAISAITAAASAAVAYKTSEDQVEAQEDYNKYLEKQAIEQYSELDKQEADAIEQSYKESMQAQREYMKARSTVELNAAATGTYGQSIDLAITDLGTGLGQRLGDITGKRNMQLDNIATEAKNIKASAVGGSDYSINQPSWYQGLNTGLSTFGSTYNTVSTTSDAYKQSRTAKTA